jgi:hypothetical protein
MSLLPAQLSGRGIDRQLGHHLAQLHADHVRAQAQLASTTARTDLGLRAVAHISAVEAELAAEVPSAATRLKFIGDVGTSTIAMIVSG